MGIFSKRLPNVRMLQCFIAVAQELNFRRAAELLNMSQPPLSRQIQSLEDLLRVKLIRRSTHSVSLTPAGEAFEKEARAVLAALGEAVHALRAQASSQRQDSDGVRLGLTSVIDFTLMPQLHDALNGAGFGGIRRSERAYSKRLVERVRNGRLDLAIVGDIAKPGDDLTVKLITHEPMMVALPAAHPAARKDRVALSDLGDASLFWFSRADNPAFYDKCERVFTSLGYAPARRLEPAEFTVLLAAIAAGEGIAFCPASMRAASRIGVVYRPFEPDIERRLTIDVQLVYRSNESRPEVLDKIDAILAATAEPC